MTTRKHKHLFPIIDAMIEDAIEEIEEEGDRIRCEKGCDHCCHLLVEISWEEAQELAYWVMEQPEEKRQEYVGRVRANATKTREIFQRQEGGSRFAAPISEDDEIPDELYDAYFYDQKMPCPFLENSMCIAYHHRPTPCRLHMVTSDPYLCSHDVDDEEEYEVPERIEQLKEEAGPVISAVEKDHRWGQLGIMVEFALNEMLASAESSQPETGLGENSDGNEGSGDPESVADGNVHEVAA